MNDIIANDFEEGDICFGSQQARKNESSGDTSMTKGRLRRAEGCVLTGALGSRRRRTPIWVPLCKIPAATWFSCLGSTPSRTVSPELDRIPDAKMRETHKNLSRRNKFTGFSVYRARCENSLALLIGLFKPAPSLKELIRVHCGSCSKFCHVNRQSDAKW